MVAQNNFIEIEVAYATDRQQEIMTVQVEVGSTIEMAIQLSGILDLFPEIDLTKQSVGIFGEKLSLSDTVKTGDRVEIYRPLAMDPKEARKERALLGKHFS